MDEREEKVINTPNTIRVMFIVHSLMSDLVEGGSLSPQICPMFFVQSVSRLL